MQPQVPLAQNTVNDIVNSCQEMVEFKLPKTVWVRFLNEGIMDLYDILFIEAEALLTREEGVGYFKLPDDYKQMYITEYLSKIDMTKVEQDYKNGSITDEQYDFFSKFASQDNNTLQLLKILDSADGGKGGAGKRGADGISGNSIINGS